MPRCWMPAALMAVAALIPSAVQARAIEAACEVLVPSAPVPGDDGTYLTVLRLTVPADADSHQHFHHAAEYLAVVSGEASLTVEGQGDRAMPVGSIATIPPKANHQIHNLSATEPLVYTATIVGHVEDPLLTRYVGEPDRTVGCPHRRPSKP